MKQPTTRAQKISVGVITAVFMATFFTSLAPVQSAFAAGTPVNDSSTNPDDWLPKTRATRWAHLTGLYHCIQSAWSGSNDWADWNNWIEQNHNKISDAHAASGDWFWDPTGPKDRDNEAAGYINIDTKDNGNGKADCNLVAQAAMKTYSMSGTELLCKLGAKREDGSDCTNSGTRKDFDPPSSGARMDVSAIWGSKDLPSNAGATAYYELNFAALMSSKGCNLQEKAGATGNFAYTLKVLDSSGKLVDKTYTGQSRDHTINVYTSYPGINNQERSCGTIAGDLNKQSGDYAFWFANHDTADVATSKDGNSGTTPTSCAVDGIGWIVCPVMGFLGKVNDSAYGFLQKFLGINPSLINSDGTINAWKAFRDLANVAFVIAFLIIVYSQLTSAGISNYGIKKMLPRIVIAAILVNLSYYICAIMVDVSNIAGSSIYTLLKNSINIGSGVTDPSWQSVISGPSGILATAITGIAVVLLAIAIFLAPTTLLAFAVVILILIARQAFVILLIVVSPLAFVAYLLPNTESWFKKWWKALMATLMVYPIIGAVFGASTLAANIISSVKDSASDDPNFLQLMALGVMAVPLFAVPVLLKGALSSAGSIGQKIAGLQDRANRRAGAGLKKSQEDLGNRWKISAMNNNSRVSRAFGGLTRRSVRREALRTSRGNEAKRSESSYFANQLGDTDDNGNYTERAQRLQNAAAGGSIIVKADPNAKVRAAAIATQGMHKQFDDDVSAFKTTMTSKSNDALLEMISSPGLSTEQRSAAAGIIMSRDHRESHLKALDAVGHASRQAEDASKSVEDPKKAAEAKLELESLSNIQKQMSHDMKDKPWALGDQAAGQLVNGVYGRSVNHEDKAQQQFGDITQEIKDRVEKKLSAASIAKMNPDEMTRILNLTEDGELNDAQLVKLQSSIKAARANPQMNDLIKSQEAEKHDKILKYITDNRPDLIAVDPAPMQASPNPAPTPPEAPSTGDNSTPPVPPINPDDNPGVL